MNLTIVLRGPTSADLGTLCRVSKESRNPPALRSLPLLPEKAILLYFCLIVYHLTSDSLKSPQISNPPLVLRTTFLHGKASHTILRSLALPYESCSLATPQAGGTIKVPQTSNLKSLPLRPSGRPLHYTGREPERPGGHSFIPRTRAFHGNGDGRAEAIT